MAEKKVTLSDVARAANVSVATASMAFSGKGRISREVAEKVRAIGEELGYKVKLPSVATRGKKKCISLLLLTDKKWAYLWYMEQRIVRELESQLAEQDYTLVLVPITEADSDKRIIEKVLATDSCGVISIHYGNLNLFKEFEKMKLPVTLVMNSDYQGQVNSICVDDFQGAYSATRHLLEKGHRDIAFIEYVKSPVRSIMMDRYIGFDKALFEHGIEHNPNWRLKVDVDDRDSFAAAVNSLFGQEHVPSAVFAIDDYIGVHFLKILDETGYTMPTDFSIISPGDVMDYDVFFLPHITTMSINFEQMARLTVDMIMGLLADMDEPVPSLKVELKLIDRGSTREKK